MDGIIKLLLEGFDSNCDLIILGQKRKGHLDILSKQGEYFVTNSEFNNKKRKLTGDNDHTKTTCFIIENDSIYMNTEEEIGTLADLIMMSLYHYPIKNIDIKYLIPLYLMLDYIQFKYLNFNDLIAKCKIPIKIVYSPESYNYHCGYDIESELKLLINEGYKYSFQCKVNNHNEIDKKGIDVINQLINGLLKVDHIIENFAIVHSYKNLSIIIDGIKYDNIDKTGGENEYSYIYYDIIKPLIKHLLFKMYNMRI